MSNLGITSNGYMDGTRATQRNNDIVQVQAYVEGNGVYIPGMHQVGDKYHAISAGLIGGVAIERKFGANPSLSTTEQDIWFNGGLYPWPIAAETVRVKAGGDVNDTNGGTGAQTIRVIGLDENWAEATEDITLDGASASSATTTTFIRILRAYVLTCGTYSATNTGDISIENTSTLNVISNIQAGFGQTQLSMYTIPAGYRGYLERLFVNVSGNKPSSMFFWQRQNADDVTTPFTSKRILRPVYELQGPVEYKLNSLGPFPEKTDLWLSGVTVAGASSADVGYDIVLEQTS